MQWSLGNDGNTLEYPGHVRLQPREGIAEEVDVYNHPTTYNTFTRADRGIYAQDTWTIDRLTINAGVRWDHFESETNTYRTGDLPAGRFVPARTAVPYDQEPFWNDVAPRFSVVYDLFGDSRTALKFSANRFMKPWTSGLRRALLALPGAGGRPDWFDCALHPDIHAGGDPRCATAADLVGLPAMRRSTCRPTATTSCRTTRSA